MAGTASLDAEPLEEAPLADPLFDRAFATERVLLITSRGPLLIELEIAIDGRPFRELREHLIDDMLRGGDTDGDGKLTWDEALANPRFTFGRLGDFAGMPPAQQRQRKLMWDWNKNNLVERDEVPRFLAQLPDVGPPFVLAEPEMAPSRPSGLGLWRRLDVDGDLQLSFDELNAIGPLLIGLDTNADDLLQSSELAVFGEGDARRTMRESGLITHAHIEPKTTWQTIGHTLTTRFGVMRKTSVGSAGERRVPAVLPECLPLDPTFVERLDRPYKRIPKNGQLDSHDLPGLLDMEPHLVLAVNFGHSTLRPPGVTVKSVWPTLGQSDEITETLPDGVRLKLPGTEAWISLIDMPGNTETLAQTQLTQFDSDKNGYLEASEFPETAAGFDFTQFDADGDGKLYLAEIATALQWRQAPLAGRVRATIQAVPRNLFAAIDTNHDNVLFPREIREAAQRLKNLDRDGDRYLTQEELDTTFLLQIERGTNMPRNDALPAADASGAPAWFQAMDVNGDGELSRREFLGTVEQFGKLDANGDGFVDGSEAVLRP